MLPIIMVSDWDRNIISESILDMVDTPCVGGPLHIPMHEDLHTHTMAEPSTLAGTEAADGDDDDVIADNPMVL